MLVAILSKVAMTFLYKSLSGHIFISLGQIPRSGPAESQGSCLTSTKSKNTNKKNLPNRVLKRLYQFTLEQPRMSIPVVPYPHQTLVMDRHFNCRHSGKDGLVSHFVFNLHFSDS